MRLASAREQLRHPQTTVRWRLTLLYGGLFLVCGAALLAVTYGLVSHATIGGNTFAVSPAGPPSAGSALFQKSASGSAGVIHLRTPASQFVIRGKQQKVPPTVSRLLGSASGRAAVRFVGTQQRIADLHQLEIESAIALAIMAIIAALLGWYVAGRVLRPLRTITAAAQEISEANLHRRLALPGPRDELRTLADTIDGLLERLEDAFDAQRQFVANASHELRTPLTAVRALLEMVISDPRASVRTFRETCREALEESEQQEQLIDALLALAQGQRGLDQREPADLAVITDEVLKTHQAEADERHLHLDVELDTATISGDRRLIARLVSNLVQNAISHNIPDGDVHIRVGTRAGKAYFAVANTGPVVPAGEVERLLQPFQRLAPDRLRQREGFGLGLSIVAAIASAHDARLGVRPGEHGGLDVEVTFPAAAPSVEPLMAHQHPAPEPTVA
ncbi:MAG TPA: HAMP domain-containing sensor histidine kinase [Solirubrobacteraceae bacterium]|nr:HAMP domain-containing sensor histidine kinase [Solirubrobacteraceae bacterium]